MANQGSVWTLTHAPNRPLAQLMMRGHVAHSEGLQDSAQDQENAATTNNSRNFDILTVNSTYTISHLRKLKMSIVTFFQVQDKVFANKLFLRWFEKPVRPTLLIQAFTQHFSCVVDLFSNILSIMRTINHQSI